MVKTQVRSALPLCSTVILLCLSSGLAAQRQHVAGLIGEPPDVSNWPHPAAPDGNPFVRSTAPLTEIRKRNNLAALGKVLFWDEQLSTDNTMACGTCHITGAAGTDNRVGAVAPNGNLGTFGVIPQAENPTTGGIDYGFTNPPSAQITRLVTPLFTPTMIGAYTFNQQFWDMRAGPDFQDNGGVTIPNFTDWASLEAQAVGPPVSDIEMAHQNIDWGDNRIVKKLTDSLPLALVRPKTIPPDVQFIIDMQTTYDVVFDKIFNGHVQFGGALGVTRERIACAIAHYERTLIPDQAPIDLGTMTSNQVTGFNILKTTGCFICHSASGNPVLATLTGRLVDPFDNPLSDGLSHSIGIGPRVKTPTLRNLVLQNRFFSTGQVSNSGSPLNNLVAFYENQPLGPPFGFGGPLSPFRRAAVIDFLANALLDSRVKSQKFPFDRPELASERPEFVFEGNEFGNGTAGASNLVPEIIANSPPHVPLPLSSNVWFKVGVGRAPANRPTFLMLSNTVGGGPIIWVGSPFAIISTPNTNAQGIGTVHAPFPLTAATLGVPFHVQWMVDDSGTFAFSDAAKFTPFQF